MQHRLCFCGFNIAILAGLFSYLATRLSGRRRGAWVAVLAILAYTLLVGASASVVRAALMGSLALIFVAARYGPAPTILDRLSGRATLRTDLNGTVTLFTDGKQLWVETER